jgi:ferredoxin
MKNAESSNAAEPNSAPVPGNEEEVFQVPRPAASLGTFTVRYPDRNLEAPIQEGEILRDAIRAHGVPLYTFINNIRNCNGGGQCGTCFVEVLEGMDNLSPRTIAEQRLLKRRAENCRLSCQALIYGNISIRTQPK